MKEREIRGSEGREGDEAAARGDRIEEGGRKRGRGKERAREREGRREFVTGRDGTLNETLARCSLLMLACSWLL